MKKHRNKIILIIGALLLIAIFFFIPYYQLANKITGHSPIRLLFLADQFKKTDGRVNLLLLGKGDAIHDGPNLTDSMMIASYDIAAKKIFLITIPRDIWSSTLEEKINAAYAFGEAKKKGGGMILAKSEIGAIVDLPIHYVVVIDFDKFKDTIDLLGGIDVTVDTAFVDNEFPIKGKENDLCNMRAGKEDTEYTCRYETIRFESGLQHMNGDTALKFSRSRHAEGDEGSDFARGKRQQKVLSAISAKMLDLVKSGNVKKLDALYEELNSAIERDIQNEESAFLAKSYILAGKVQLINIPLSEDLFEVPNVDDYFGKYVLIPVNNDFPALHKYIREKMK